jgi:16S rRNA (cytidine1402-2'-O)-methyltransferase
VIFFEAPHRIEKTMAELLSVVGDVPVAIGRELTKVHEEWVRGPISTAIGRIHPRGEFTVVAELGRSGEQVVSQSPPSGGALEAEIGQLMETGGVSRRVAAAIVARRHGLTANAVYSAAERAKKKGTD